MSDEIRLAFSHPLDRAVATGDGRLRDRISLRDYVVEVEIGAFQAERGTTQRVRFNVVVEVRAPGAELDDDVDRILSYDLITEAIKAELSEERLNLLETLAERVADHILADPKAARVFVRIEKLDRGPGALGVEIVRDRAPARAVEVEAPAPLVVFLGNDAVHGAYLSAWLDRLEALDTPVVICVGASDRTDPPQANIAPAQRRIDLLAIEQNAWVLAGRDARCVVVDTRTEIDWAMKQGQMTVWAPSKIVLDAVDRPSVPNRDAVGLALWLAQHLGAARFLSIGATLPETPVIKAQSVAAADVGAGL